MQEKGSRYKVEREIGRGAFGVVYLARDNFLQRNVALKVISVPDGLSPDERDQLIERFHREARAAAGLSHPNIVIIHDISRAGERHFISMEFLEGEPLSDAMGDKPLPPGRVLKIADQILAALQYAHSRSVVHRDIKPDNIFLLPGDTVKLVDFGLARVQATTTITRSGAVMGSPGYIAPEVVEGRPADARTDVFSFGVVLYEMLTGDRPFGPRTVFESFIHVIYRIMSEDPAPPSSINDAVSPELDEIVARCLAKDPDMRFQDAAALRTALASTTVAEKLADTSASLAEVGVEPVPYKARVVTTDLATSPTVADSAPVAGEDLSGVTESVVVGWNGVAETAPIESGTKRKWWIAGGAVAVVLIIAAIILSLILLSGASSEVDVPNLINLSSQKARDALGGAGLVVGEVTEGFSFDIWKGKVMKQMPAAGTRVKKEGTVDFVVSLGNDVVQVPDVINQPEATAEQTLKIFGFTIEKENAFKKGVTVGHVFEQRPAPGIIKARGTKVVIVVNTGRVKPLKDGRLPPDGTRTTPSPPVPPR